MPVRRVLAHEYPKYCQHLLALSLESRHLRFGYAIRDDMIETMSDAWQCNYRNHTLFAIENAQLELVAVAHVAREPSGMELAFSVLDSHQGQGLGSLLMERVIQYCRYKGLLDGHMVCLPHNQAIRHLCTKHGIRLTTEHGETEGLIHLPCADYTTFLNEYVDRNMGIVDYWSKRLGKVQQSVQ